MAHVCIIIKETYNLYKTSFYETLSFTEKKLFSGIYGISLQRNDACFNVYFIRQAIVKWRRIPWRMNSLLHFWCIVVVRLE